MKIFSVLAEFVLWELSIVSSLSLYSILVQHACNDLRCAVTRAELKVDVLAVAEFCL